MEPTQKRKKAPAPALVETRKPSPEVEKKRAYDALVALRRKVERTADEMAAAERTLRSARTITSSFMARDLAVEQAQEVLDDIRVVHAEAVRDFEAARSRS